MVKIWQEYWEDLADVLARHFLESKIEWSDHALKQMAIRNISKRSTQIVVDRNVPHEMYATNKYPHGPNPFSNPDPVFSITGRDAVGRWITVAVAVQKHYRKLHFIVVTVLDPSENSRHRKK